MTYTKLTFNSTSPKPHDFIGSKLRGILGYILKDEVCINPTLDCKNCFAQDKCVFYDMYEKQNKAHQYRFKFELYDKEFKFSLLLFGTLQKYANKISNAMLESLKDYKDVQMKVEKKEFTINNYSSIVKIDFLTPLRIKANDKFATNSKDLDFITILSSINRLYYDISSKPYEKLNISKDYKIVSSHLKYKKILRQSNRQNKKMEFGGVMGDMIVSNIDKKSYELLKFAQLVGMGKNRVFGLGNIKVEDIG